MSRHRVYVRRVLSAAACAVGLSCATPSASAQPMPSQPPPPSAPWMPPAAPAPWTPPPRDPDLSPSGLPLGQRGRIGFDTASYLDTAGEHGVTSFELLATLPLFRDTFVDLVAPFSGLGTAGNPTVGGHHLVRLGRGVLLSWGGTLGVPLLREAEISEVKQVLVQGTSEVYTVRTGTNGRRAIPSGYWNIHYYYHDALPLTARLGFELQRGAFHLRLQAEPTWLIALGDPPEPSPNPYLAALEPPPPENEGTFQHAVELQLGHRVAGGVRLQGVVLGWGENKYQAAVEPFFAVEHDLAMLRLGLLLPLDEPLAPAFEDSWGLRISMGMRLE
jgi:hypothetical protein